MAGRIDPAAGRLGVCMIDQHLRYSSLRWRAILLCSGQHQFRARIRSMLYLRLAKYGGRP
jgi:hypothetical protein